MKINMRQFKKWIEALDSGEHKQTKDTLQNYNGYCCMGVGCVVLVPKYKLRLQTDEDLIFGDTPEQQKEAPLWLKQIDRDFGKKTGGTMVQQMNDDLNLTFPEIATMLELVYIHKAFD